MKLDGGVCHSLSSAQEAAERAERRGYDGLWVAETVHNPFPSCAVALEHTARIAVGTAVAVALAYNPMTMAQIANDLHTYSKGRFVLGLGSQVKPHIERRFSMPWSRPAARMKEFVLAMRAIWDCWHHGHVLDFHGEFYSHDLMTPFFDPGPSAYGPAPIFLAGVGERMAEVAGEVCDGFIAHTFTTEKYLRSVTLPALQRGRERAGRTMAGFDICLPPMIVHAGDPGSEAEIRRRIAFYASTPAYRPVLDVHGWGDLQHELTTLSKQGRWDDMPGLIDDGMLREFAAVGDPESIAEKLSTRFGDCVSRLNLPAAEASATGRWDHLVAGLRARC